MVAVRVRHVEQVRGSLLGHFEPHEIYQLPELFKNISTYHYSQGDICQYESSQWVCAPEETYFEIILDDVDNSNG